MESSIKINTNKPYKIYAEYLEHEAIQQFQNCMNENFVVQGALMPDCHTGYAAPIGSVIKTVDYVVPAWIGYDQGCGMCAVKLNIKHSDISDHLEQIKTDILKTIPLGNNTYKTNAPDVPKQIVDMFTETGLNFLKTRGKNQLGTLGGGNHFIEISVGSGDNVWIVIHSGSRGLGHGIAGHYMKLAGKVNGITTGNMEKNFAFKKGTVEFEGFMQDLLGAQEWALENRKVMIQKIQDIIDGAVGIKTSRELFINRNHNHVDITETGYIHRKGATHAELGMYGVIPANMRDGSFIVKGKGNPDSLCSSSHGAGRVLSRSKAKELLNFEEFKDMMEGVVTNISENTLDESPLAYKNIFEVMENQKDLVDVVDHVLPILNIKG